MAHRIYHWKHGWIPLDGYAQLQQSHHQAAITKTGGSYYETIEKVEGAPHVKLITHPDAYPPFFALDHPTDRLTAAQKREVAGVVQSVFDRFPGLHQGHDQRVEAVTDNSEYWGATDAQGRGHKLALNSAMWKDPQAVKGQMAEWAQDHGAIAGQTSSMKEFRRRTMLHEMGHVIHLRTRDQAATNPIDEMAFEPVTPREMGWTGVDNGDDSVLDHYAPRYLADTLDRKSAYANSSEMEWFAEAFLDGMVNGQSASPSGKRAIAITESLYGKGA